MGRWYRGVLLSVVVTGGCGSEAPEGEAASVGEPARASPPAAKAEPPRCPEPRASLAQRMSPTISQACERVAVERAVDPMQLDMALDLSLSGTWNGEYASDGLGSSPTRFEATLFSTGGVVSGTTTEPNTFGPYGYTELQADINGEALATRQVVLLKTYRTATVTHSVLYIGQLDATGKRIEGRWRQGGSQGTFWIARS